MSVMRRTGSHETLVGGHSLDAFFALPTDQVPPPSRSFKVQACAGTSNGSHDPNGTVTPPDQVTAIEKASQTWVSQFSGSGKSMNPSHVSPPAPPQAPPPSGKGDASALSRGIDKLIVLASTPGMVQSDGRASAAYASQICTFELQHREALEAHPSIRARLQDLQARLGVTTTLFPDLPIDKTPLWLRGPDPFANYQSTPELPEHVDFLIVGAGITGSALMRMLLQSASDLLRAVLMEGARRGSYQDLLAYYDQLPTTAKLTQNYRDALRRVLDNIVKHHHAALATTEITAEIHRALHGHVARGLFDSATVVVIDADDPCRGASGRNGGNRGLTENFQGTYQGLFEERVKLRMQSTHVDMTSVPPDVLTAAERDVQFIICAWDRCRDIQEQMLVADQISCDLKSGGWLKVAGSPEEEEALKRDAALLSRHGFPSTLLTADEIRDRVGFPVSHGGHLTVGATYHPVKAVRGVLSAGLQRGGRMYTRTRVMDIVDDGDTGRQKVTVQRHGKTSTIRAEAVLLATNAYTGDFLPEMHGKMHPRRSQVAVFEKVPNRLGIDFFTKEHGDDYANHPFPDTLIQGGDEDEEIAPGVDPEPIWRSHELLVKYGNEKCGPQAPDELYRDGHRCWVPPTAEWSGRMAFTNGRLPYVGRLRKPMVPVAAAVASGRGLNFCGGDSGYGNTFLLYCASLQVAELTYGERSQWADLLDPYREPIEGSGLRGAVMIKSKL